MELWRYYRKLYRRKWIIVVGMILCVGVAMAATLMQPVTYTSVARIMERQPQYAGSNVYVEGVYTGVDPQMRLNNLSGLLRTRDLYQRAVTQINRQQATSWTFDELGKYIDIQPERDSQILRLSITYKDPDTAVAAAQILVDEFSKYYREKFYQPEEMARFLEARVKVAKQELSDKRAALESYKRQRGLNNLDVDVQAKLARVSEMESQWRTAQVMAAEASNRRSAVQRELSKLPKRREEQRTTGDNGLWMNLETDLNRQEQQLASMMVRRGPNHPEVIALQKSIGELKSRLATEQRQRLVQKVDAVNPVYSGTLDRYVQAKVDAMGNSAKASAFAGVVPAMKSELTNYPEDERKLADLTFEAKTAETTYGTLREKLDEARIRELEPYSAGRIEIVERPSSDLVERNGRGVLKVLLALPLSILLSCALIFLLDYLDNTVKTPEEVEDLLGLPVSTMVAIGRGHSMIRGRADPGLRESFQMLSAALWYRAGQSDGKSAIVVASAEPDTGRTVTAGNLAASLASDGARVILVDADLRKPAQHLVFGVNNAKGLTNILTGSAALEDVAVPTKVEGLLLVPSGPLPDNPVRLLHSDAMKAFVENAAAVADFVVFDTPAGAAFVDATVIASFVKRVLLVQCAGRVPQGAEVEFSARLQQVGAEFVGVVLNKVRPEASHGAYHFRTAYAGLPGPGNPPGSVSPTSPAIPG